MIIKLTRKRGSSSLRFEAENNSEGIDLKDVVLSMPKDSNLDAVADAIDELGRRGYKGALTRRTTASKTFTVRKVRIRKAK